ncbi:MAG: ABC transporter permease [Blautia sp.]|nr:ABC transporter permease [Blautia sp.]
MEYKSGGDSERKEILYHRHFSGNHKLLDFKVREVWRYRDLIILFARREFVVNYKQTILGPFWIFISPMLTSSMYAFVFGKVAGINTDGIPTLLFYLFSNAAWTMFASCVNNCAESFTQNASILSKVYFPRLVMPVSNLMSAFLHFGLQAIPAGCFYFYYLIRGTIHANPGRLLLLPVALIQMGLIGFGTGIIVAALTTKYRDLRILVKFGVTLWMYATPVVYPLSALSGRALFWVSLNPAAAPIELFRYSLWGEGTVTAGMLTLSWAITAVLAVSGIMLFNHVERIFADTV